jgi:ATP-binding cassette, subfamily F, member 3
MLSAIEISKHFGERTLLDKVQFTLKPKERVALVGRNGCGKTTLLKIMAGLEGSDSGKVVLVPGYRLGYLGQEGQLEAEIPLYQELGKVFDELRALEVRLRELESKMSLHLATDQDLSDYSRLQEQVLNAEPHLQDARIRSIAFGLGFSVTDLEKLCGQFSGGWQMRGALAKLLLSQPDVLLLDEPTNHLDIEGVEWLEQFLLDFAGAVLIISHDRAFLDKVANRTVELSDGELEDFSGNYSYYLEESARRFDLQLNAYKNQQKKLVQDRRFIERFRSKATLATRVKSREKMLEKIDMLDLPKPEQRAIRISFEQGHDSGRASLTAKGLTKSYNDQPVLTGISIALERGEKVAIVGKNGCGKSTLLRILCQEEAPDAGKVQAGYRLIPAYFAQHQAEALAVAHTPLEELSSVAQRGTTETQLRSLLGSLLFQGDDVYKKIQVLSGGERSRVALAKCMVKPSNLLFLDEPTNHLDINSRDVLLSALEEYAGSILMVTHDRYLMDQIATSIWEISDGQLRVFKGNYTEYRRDRDKLAAATVVSSKPASQSKTKPVSPITSNGMGVKVVAPAPKKANYWKLEALEKKIFQLEEEMGKLSSELSLPENQSDYTMLQKLQDDFEAKQTQCNELTELWEQMVS